MPCVDCVRSTVSRRRWVYSSAEISFTVILSAIRLLMQMRTSPNRYSVGSASGAVRSGVTVQPAYAPTCANLRFCDAGNCISTTSYLRPKGALESRKKFVEKSLIFLLKTVDNI